MDIEWLRRICLSLPAATEEVKWGNDLCFLVGGKMFCVTGLNDALKISFKVSPDQFAELTHSPGFIPAPYLARAHWVQLHDLAVLHKDEVEHYVRQSYEIIKSKLSKKSLAELGIG